MEQPERNSMPSPTVTAEKEVTVGDNAPTAEAGTTACSNKFPGKITATFKDNLTFSSDFDSGNLAKVEEFAGHGDSDWREFDLWVSNDCEGTEFANGNRSWFYFSVTVPQAYVGKVLRFNIMNLNKQMKLYQQGLAPITKTVPGRGSWERLRTRLSYEYLEGSGMKLSFYFNITDSRKHTLYFAFCYPHSYAECQRRLEKLDNRFRSETKSDIYYHRELLCKSLEDRRIDLITVTSSEGVTEEREERLPHLFPDKSTERSHVFRKKKVVFVSSRVHPGETPSSHVFNGLLQFLLRTDDDRAIAARKNFVFKLIPMLNPDGVCRGHYRTDSRGVNLNRFYLDPDRELHPSIFAAKSMLLYYHQLNDTDKTYWGPTSSSASNFPSSPEPEQPLCSAAKTSQISPPSENCQPNIANDLTRSCAAESTQSCTAESCHSIKESISSSSTSSFLNSESALHQRCESDSIPVIPISSDPEILEQGECNASNSSSEHEDSLLITKNSGIALYVDLHAHAAKRGVFIYGNYFKDISCQVENMLFPKLLSLNSPHLDFDHCVFSERNMYAMDKKTGLSKEGSGRVGMHKATGIIPCYTLECNYNSGRQLNAISEATMDRGRASPGLQASPMSHRFSIADLEEVGRALVISLLDYHQINPWSRLPTTSFGSIAGVRLSLIQRLRITRAAGKILPDESESQISDNRTTNVNFPDVVMDYEVEKLPLLRPHSGVSTRVKNHQATGLSIQRSKKHLNLLDTSGNASCVNFSSKKAKQHELKPKLANVVFPAVSTITESVSNPSFKRKGKSQVAAGKCCKGTTVLVKKNLSMNDVKQTPPIQSDSIKTSNSSQQQNSILRGKVAISHRHMDRSMLLREIHITDGSPGVSTRKPQTPAVATRFVNE